MSASKSTPLYDEHNRAGARMIEFGGWLMPVQYSGIVDEHQTVRQAVGVFDISHMGQLRVTGGDAAAWLNRMLTNNVDRLEPGEGQYTFLLNEDGGVIDDLILYRLGAEEFFLVVNAARTEVDVDWLRKHLPESGAALNNLSADFAGLAIQGPKSARLFDLFFGQDHARPARNEIKHIECDCLSFHIARTGYTGEDGFEIFFPAGKAPDVWRAVLEKGASLGIKPCGLGARDTLRLEMCYPLNGSDLSPTHTPLEAGMSIFVDLQKPEFIGRDVLVRQKERGIPRRLVPFRMTDKSPPPRPHYRVMRDGVEIGEVASGTLSPSLNNGIGMAYLPSEMARINEKIEIEIRGKCYAAVIERKPLYRRPA